MRPLHTEGRYMKNDRGQKVHLVGCARSHDFKFSDVTREAGRLSSLGVQWIRLFLKASKWVEADYRALVDQYVAEFTARGVYVCLVNMENRPWVEDLDPSNLIAFLEGLATRYQDNPGMMGISIWNEPPLGALGLDKWRSWAKQAAAALHAVNPKLLIYLSAYLWNRQGIDPYWANSPSP